MSLSILKAGERLWPEDYESPRLAADHCLDVLQGCYDLAYFPNTPPVILDLGANIGAFVRWASVRWPGCKIHAYEPQDRNFELLTRTVAALPNKADIAIRKAAVFSESGHAKLSFGGINCGEFSLINLPNSKPEPTSTELIDVATLPKADVLKMDVEGVEYLILKRLVEAGRLGEFSAVMLEFHSQEYPKLIGEIMEKAGFAEVHRIIRNPNRGEMKFLRKELGSGT